MRLTEHHCIQMFSYLENCPEPSGSYITAFFEQMKNLRCLKGAIETVAKGHLNNINFILYLHSEIGQQINGSFLSDLNINTEDSGPPTPTPQVKGNG